MSRIQSVFKKVHVEHEVNGTKFKFYRISPKKLAECFVEFKGLIGLGSRLWKTRVTTSQESSEVTKTGEVYTLIEPSNPELVERQKDARQKDVDKIVTALHDANIRYALADMVIDSLRDEPERKEGRAAVEAFADNDDLDVPTFVSYLQGVYRANTEAFGPLVQPFRDAVVAATKRILNDAKAQQEPEQEVPESGPTTTS